MPAIFFRPRCFRAPGERQNNAGPSFRGDFQESTKSLQLRVRSGQVFQEKINLDESGVSVGEVRGMLVDFSNFFLQNVILHFHLISRRFIPVIQGAGNALKQAITELILHVEVIEKHQILIKF